jgi:hypothetical protein
MRRVCLHNIPPQTRSGALFSPFAQIIQSACDSFDFSSLLRQKVACEDPGQNDTEGYDLEPVVPLDPEVSHTAPSPFSSPLSPITDSPESSRPPTPPRLCPTPPTPGKGGNHSQRKMRKLRSKKTRKLQGWLETLVASPTGPRNVLHRQPYPPPVGSSSWTTGGYYIGRYIAHFTCCFWCCSHGKHKPLQYLRTAVA